MSIIIVDPLTHDSARVTQDGQLHVVSEVHSIQHHVSKVHGETYQFNFEDTGIASGTNVLGVLINASSTKIVVVSYIRLQHLDLTGGTAIPDSGSYFTVNVGQETYTSGGTVNTPINMNQTSGNTADVTAYDTNPTLGGSTNEIDRYYLKDNAEEHVYNKEGSIILGKNDSISTKLVTDNSGLGRGRITFFLIDKEKQ